MKTKPILITLLLIAFLIAGPQALTVRSEVISGQVVIKMTAGGKPEDVLRGSGAQIGDSIPGRQTFLIEIAATEDYDSIVSALEADSQVIFVEPNYSVELPENYQMSISFPDDYAPPLLDGIQPSSFFDQPAVYSIGIEEAQQTATGLGVTVAVIDNGVDYAHPLLESRLSSNGFDFIDNDSNATYEPGSVTSHGTFVSGLIALTAPDCVILPLRAFDGDGLGSTYAIADAIYYALDQGAQVINMSFGTHEDSRIIGQACMAAIAAGATMVAASGNNSSSEPTYPASMLGVIAVSGLDESDQLASFSNYGDYIDVCAPAVNLYSALAGDFDWGTWSGTSFAAPFVSAACAMILQINPDNSTFIMEQYIRETASTDFQWGVLTPPDPAFGFGRIDVAAAVTQASSSETIDYGDLDGNGQVNAGDVVFLVIHIHLNGQPPVYPANPDANCDGVVDNLDIEYYINRIFGNGPRPGACH